MRNVSFDRIAPVYDLLAGLIFGGAISASQKFIIPNASRQTKILVLGGGTGKFLPALLQLNPIADVWFIDSSAEMISRARKRTSSGRVHYILGTEDLIPAHVKFDAVLTFFYLDLFDPVNLTRVIRTIKEALAPESLWLATDFIDDGKWWQSLFLKMMYRFFDQTCDIAAQALPDWRKQLQRSGWTCSDHKSFYFGFIESSVYRTGNDSFE